MRNFAGSRLKIRRANHHIEQLNAIIREFVKTKFYDLSVEVDPRTGLDVLKLEMKRPMPDDVPLVIGDALHNLHSALDLMAYDLILESGGTPSKGLYFPFAKDREKLVNVVRKGELRIAGAAVGDLIIDTIKPFPQGNDVLLGLHELDITDKHKLLVPVVSVVALRGVSAVDSNRNRFTGMTLAVGQGGQLRAIATNAFLEITNYGKPELATVFGNDQPFEGQHVIPVLHQLSELVSGIISACEAAFFR